VTSLITQLFASGIVFLSSLNYHGVIKKIVSPRFRLNGISNLSKRNIVASKHRSEHHHIEYSDVQRHQHSLKQDNRESPFLRHLSRDELSISVGNAE